MPNSATRSTFERIVINQFTPLHCAQAREMLGWDREQLSSNQGFQLRRLNASRHKPPCATLPGWPWPTALRRKAWCSSPGLAPVAGAMFAAQRQTRWTAKILP